MINTIKSAMVGMTLLGAASTAQAIVMDFGQGNAATIVTGSPLIQNGMTMTPLNTGTSAVANHWDWFRNTQGATSSDWHAGIHTGNNGEEVQFTYNAGTFDMLSILIEGVILDSDNIGGLTGTFTSSAGGSTTVSSAGVVDFTTLTGFSNISWLKFSMPSGVGRCDVAGSDCSTMMFDDVTYQKHVPTVPAPATLALFGLGLVGVGAMRRKASC